MNDLRPANDDEVILAWLQAEMESPRFAESYRPFPGETADDTAYIKRIIGTPNIDDPAENFIRKTKLAVARGFGCGRYIFIGLTNDITWRRVRFTSDEVGQMLYANNVASWRTLATLLLSKGVHPKVVSEMLGHSTVAITLDVYSHVTASMHKEAAKVMDGIFG